MMRMNKNTTYRICQLVGWTIICLYDLILYSYRFGYNDGLLINAAITLGLGISVTHAYRLVIQRFSWLDLPLNQLIPKITASVLLMAIVMVMFSVPLDYFTVPEVRNYFSLQGIVFFIINWSKYLLLWSVIYHLFQYFERSRKFATSNQ